MLERLKKGWTRVAFGDVVQLCRERSSDPAGDGLDRYVGLEHLDPGDLKIRRWGNVADGTTFTNVFRAGQVLFGKRRAYQRKVALAEYDGVCSGDIYVLEAKSDGLLPELLPFICQTDRFFEHAVGTSAGSLSPRTNWESLSDYEFILPPLEEQCRIAEVLVASNTFGEALSTAVDHLRMVRRSAIDGLTENAEWTKTTIGDICEMQNGRPFPGSAYGENGVRLLRPGNLGQSGYFAWDPSKTTWLPRSWEENAKGFVVDAGDVVMNLTAQSLEDGFMGRVCLAREGDRSLLNQRIGRFHKWSTEVIPEFIFRVFQTSRFQHHAVQMCEGSKVKHIFWPYISRYELSLPSRHAQARIVACLRAVDAVLDQSVERKSRHKTLHQQMMADLLQSVGDAGMRAVTEGTCK